ncbi:MULTISPECIES: RelA/SpoT family protein [Acidithiobacillus]|jgi:guanosine-3',5'-bis(diphosphate) 3'-pyrophosphohydrolase|uniref:RelA/SpoT family protein n=1 Tax=Acidithiobacillus TaxID=119977 RepID=UPI000B26809B|nr:MULTISPECIES: bifunctional (p)ppGpp synthetase/guanosine-3',5'-bis(diphosphate) 3'-pyrophosphohydrolase [Acidithiobacillus]WMT47986.1 MAG: bifunctional (p)ppGpp synthetase/guanosine-3',5'-bis(diphosphate) 3'-pyrophosphohydrolase [Acidithiobacillus caldus]
MQPATERCDPEPEPVADGPGAVLRLPPVRPVLEDPCAPLRELLRGYLPAAEVQRAREAYEFAAGAHGEQTRRSGEPYIHHPVAVACILAELRLDIASVQAALLHDVIEDCGVSKEEIAERFGAEVAELVDGVSKLGQVRFETREEAQAENFRKMFLAMSRDIRVVLIKLADRLHNMRTMGVMSAEKRRRISRETLDIYAPIAQRLGIQAIRIELEELAFSHLYPKRWHALSDAIKAARGNRKEAVQKIEQIIAERLRQEAIVGEVSGREKHVYSIYRKMQAKGLPFSAIHDLHAFRIIVKDVDTCYRVLGIVHSLFRPLPGRFKDYIAIPKSNGYQSLHTVLLGPFGHPVEIQIRTEDMHRVAEAGVAAHWLYKSGAQNAHAEAQARAWLQRLLELQAQGGDSQEFLENIKLDLFPDEVYVFTPKGKILSLPRGATAVDFAYAVHTDVGNRAVAARINDMFAPLRTLLNNGDKVEIITAASARPQPGWLDVVVTAKARTSIRAHLKTIQQDEAEMLGRNLLDKALQGLGSSLADLGDGALRDMPKAFGKGSEGELLAAVGMGEIFPLVLAHKLLPVEDQGRLKQTARRLGQAVSQLLPGRVSSGAVREPLLIRGTEGLPVTLARCCRPIPGDPILGFITAGKGIVVHTHDCHNIREWRKRRDRWVDVQWDPKVQGEFPVTIRVVAESGRGVLARIATHIADADANIDRVDIEPQDGLYTGITFTILVHDRTHLARVERNLRTLPSISRVQRVKG